MDVFFQVVLTAAGETNPNNNTGWTDAIPVVERGFPRLFQTRVLWAPNGNWSQGILPTVPGQGDDMLQAVWPLPEFPSQPFVPPPGMEPNASVHRRQVAFDRDCDGDGIISGDGECLNGNGDLIGYEANFLLQRLHWDRQVLASGAFGPDRLVFLYAWVNDSVLEGFDGFFNTGFANVGIGTDLPERGQMAFAHEFAHMVGLDHVNPDV